MADKSVSMAGPASVFKGVGHPYRHPLRRKEGLVLAEGSTHGIRKGPERRFRSRQQFVSSGNSIDRLIIVSATCLNDLSMRSASYFCRPVRARVGGFASGSDLVVVGR